MNALQRLLVQHRELAAPDRLFVVLPRGGAVPCLGHEGAALHRGAKAGDHGIEGDGEGEHRLDGLRPRRCGRCASS